MKKIFAITVLSFLPIVASAQALSQIRNVNNLSTRILGIGNLVIYVLISLAIVYIIWNIVYYFIRPAGESRTEASMNILWGIVGLFVIFSIWGLVNILINTFYTDANIPKDRFPNANFVNSNLNTNVNVVVPVQNTTP